MVDDERASTSGGWVKGSFHPVPPEMEASIAAFREDLSRAADRERGALVRSGDAAQYVSEPMPEGAVGGPQVTLLAATPDPLGVVAAHCLMYEGTVVRGLTTVTDEQRRSAFEDMKRTVLNGPLEAAQFTFLVEGVTRAFTHQAVRSRGSFFAQESLRFAVKEGWLDEVPLPPSLAGLAVDHPWRRMWQRALIGIEGAYEALVTDGMPAEEARGLLPHSVTTRYLWTCDLRTLLAEAGKRTCTQAQFEWRQVFAEVARVLRNYEGPSELLANTDRGSEWGGICDAWQFELISEALRPYCYQSGSCGFMAKFDRGCKIRDRVEANARAGRPSSEWHEPKVVEQCRADSDCPGGCGMEEEVTLVEAIDPAEWACDPGAARTKVEGGDA